MRVSGQELWAGEREEEDEAEREEEGEREDKEGGKRRSRRSRRRASALLTLYWHVSSIAASLVAGKARSARRSNLAAGRQSGKVGAST